MANRYELRSLQNKRMRYSNSNCNYNTGEEEEEEDSRQLLSRPHDVLPLIKGGFVHGNGISSEEAEAKYMSLIRDKMCDSEDENVVDEGSDASVERYAMIAADHHCKKYKNLELVVVGAGPLAVGNFSGGRRIFHFNYKAKNNDAPDAVVHTYFTELTTNTNTDGVGVTLHRNICLGPSDSLPEKANTQGCLYCLSHSIHHPDSPNTFRNGGSQFRDTLRSELRRVDDYLEKGSKRRDFSPKFNHPGMVFIGNVGVDRPETEYALVALRMFNLEQRTKFELVRNGPWAMRSGSLGFIYHLNFEAKHKVGPKAPTSIHTFFAQVIESNGIVFAHFCKCLGQSESFPDEIELHGCQLCIPRHSSCSPRVHHPPGPGYLTGREYLVEDGFPTCKK